MQKHLLVSVLHEKKKKAIDFPDLVSVAPAAVVSDNRSCAMPGP